MVYGRSRKLCKKWAGCRSEVHLHSRLEILVATRSTEYDVHYPSKALYMESSMVDRTLDAVEDIEHLSSSSCLSTSKRKVFTAMDCRDDDNRYLHESPHYSARPPPSSTSVRAHANHAILMLAHTTLRLETLKACSNA